jgi:pilus assembly protein CpaF
MLNPDNDANIPVDRNLVLQYRNAVISEISSKHGISLHGEASNALRADIRKSVSEIVVTDTRPLSMYERGVVLQEVLDEMFGFGPLGPLLRNPALRELFVQDESNIFVREAKILERRIASAKFEDAAHLMKIINRVLRANNLELSPENPIASLTLSNGNLLFITKRVDKEIPTLLIRMPD